MYAERAGAADVPRSFMALTGAGNFYSAGAWLDGRYHGDPDSPCGERAPPARKLRLPAKRGLAAFIHSISPTNPVLIGHSMAAASSRSCSSHPDASPRAWLDSSVCASRTTVSANSPRRKNPFGVRDPTASHFPSHPLHDEAKLPARVPPTTPTCAPHARRAFEQSADRSAAPGTPSPALAARSTNACC